MDTGAKRAINPCAELFTPYKTVIIPGHGSVGDKSQLIEYRDMLVDVRDKVAKLKKEGKSVDEAIAAKPTAQYDDKWGGFVIKPDTFVRLAFAGV